MRISKFSENNTLRSCILIWAMALLFIFVMSPFLNFGFSNDDATNSLILDRLNHLKMTPVEYSLSEVNTQFEKGRIQPVGLFLNNMAWAQQPSQKTYWIFRIVATLFALLSFALVLTLWGVTLLEGIMISFLFILFVQARTTHEPIANYGYLPVIASLGFSGLYFGIRALRSNNLHLAILSSAILLIDVLYYEISLCFFAILIALAHAKAGKRALLCFSVAPALYLGAVAWVRHYFSAQVNGMSFNEPLKFIEATLHQVGGMLPLNHLMFRWPSAIQKYPFWPGPLEIIGALISGGMAYFIFNSSKLRTISISNNFKREISVVALGLILIPTFLIVIVERYRNSIQGGAPYLPVYLGYFGFILIILNMKSRLDNKRAWKMFSSFCGITIALQFYQNHSVAQIENYRWFGFRVKLESALKVAPLNGILDAKDLYLRGDLCDWYRYPYLHFADQSDYWFKSHFGKGPKTHCLNDSSVQFPSLEMTELPDQYLYKVKWQPTPDNVVYLEL